MLFRPKNKPVNSSVNIMYGDKTIEMVTSMKTLGVTFSSNMLWDEHIDALTIQLSKVIGMMWKCKSLLPFKVKLLIYNSVFYSYLYYCLLVWGTTTFNC